MTKPLTTIMWAPAFKVGTRWEINPYFMYRTRAICKREYEGANDIDRPVKFIKVRITEVQTAGYSPSRRK